MQGEGTLAANWPQDKFAVGLTDRRLVMINFTGMGKPKEIAVEYPLQEVARVELESRKLMQAVLFEFIDGSSVVVECGTLEKVRDFVSAFQKAKGSAGQN